MELKVGSNIKRLRIAKNITQEQLSVAMNVTGAAVSKWERGETYPDITLLQPLAYFFGVTLDELIGYDQGEIQAEIDEVIAIYRQHPNDEEGREIITKAYRNYPNDYWIMYYYMLNITGNFTDSDTDSLLSHKEEIHRICNKILDGCTEENLRLGAWNMRARILNAEGKTEEAFEIYFNKLARGNTSVDSLHNGLFAKNTNEYYFCIQKHTYKSACIAGDGLGRMLLYDSELSTDEKADRAIMSADAMIASFEKTGEALFLAQASDFLGIVEFMLCYPLNGTDDQIIAIVDRSLYVKKLLEELKKENKALRCGVYGDESHLNLFAEVLTSHVNATSGRLAELLKNPDYKAVLDKYI